MGPLPEQQRYNSLSILLHWLMLVLLVGVYLTAELGEGREAGGVVTWHYALGLTVFALVWIRVVARLLSPVPRTVGSGWRNAVGNITHVLLYILMIGMPLIGWFLVSAEGETVFILAVDLPHLIPPNRHLAEQLEEVHEIGGTLGYWLVGLHTLAALFHQYVLRDRLIGRMLPERADYLA